VRARYAHTPPATHVQLHIIKASHAWREVADLQRNLQPVSVCGRACRAAFFLFFSPSYDDEHGARATAAPPAAVSRTRAVFSSMHDPVGVRSPTCSEIRSR